MSSNGKLSPSQEAKKPIDRLLPKAVLGALPEWFRPPPGLEAPVGLELLGGPIRLELWEEKPLDKFAPPPGLAPFGHGEADKLQLSPPPGFLVAEKPSAVVGGPAPDDE